jgi:3-phosphoshikimate 1-carboxyvinyltransferase
MNLDILNQQPVMFRHLYYYAAAGALATLLSPLNAFQLKHVMLPTQTRATSFFRKEKSNRPSTRSTVLDSISGSVSADHELKNPLTLHPIKSLDGIVTLPGSKSLSNRCLLLAALSDSKTRVENLLESDDIRYMLEALDQMKVPVERHNSNDVTVTGQSGPINSPLREGETCQLFLGNAGTAMRPLAAALCMGKGRFVLDGVPRMRERPIADLIDGLQQLGANVECVKETGCPPVTIQASPLKGGKVSERGTLMIPSCPL